MSQAPTGTANPPINAVTNHAMLVAWGQYAQSIGLVEKLEQVPVPQRSRDHTPQTKLIEFLVSILGGCAYLQDISRGPHPLDQDLAVARAWGQPRWADYSGVSRTLRCCDGQTLSAIQEALWAVSRPLIEQEVMLALRERGVLIYDGDLTGRPVSNTSTTYPGAGFGWMGDGVQLGYQAALVSLHSPSYGRLWLSVAAHPGDTVSSSQAEALVRAAEAHTGVRPRRRVDLLVERIGGQQALMQEEEAKSLRAEERVAQVRQHVAQVEQERQEWARQLVDLEQSYAAQNRSERPYSHLAQARRKLAVRERRLFRCQRELARAHRWLESRHDKLLALRQELEHLGQRLDQFREDNVTNAWPIRAIFRLDGGFGSGFNVALLIEMGYDVYTKATSHQTVRAFRRRLTEDAPWTRVGKNAEMVAWTGACIARCPYRLDVALERFHTCDQVRHGLLLHYGTHPVTDDLAAWFTFYNGRQTIEAGIKEGKNVFQMHHLKVRAVIGLAIQEAFAAFAANFIRWAAVWLYDSNPGAATPFDQPQPSVKQMVRVAANTSAWVVLQPGGCLLRFTELSAFTGIELVIREATPIQLALPLFKSCVFSPISMILPLVAQPLR